MEIRWAGLDVILRALWSVHRKAALVSKSLAPKWSSECSVPARVTEWLKSPPFILWTYGLLLFCYFFFLKVIKAIEKITVWRETRLINSKWIRSVPGSQICTQIKNKTLQTQGLKSSSVKHLSLNAYLGLVFLSEARFCLKIISNRWGYQNCQHVTNWWENPVS